MKALLTSVLLSGWAVDAKIAEVCGDFGPVILLGALILWQLLPVLIARVACEFICFYVNIGAMRPGPALVLLRLLVKPPLLALAVLNVVGVYGAILATIPLLTHLFTGAPAPMIVLMALAMPGSLSILSIKETLSTLSIGIKHVRTAAFAPVTQPGS